MYSKAYDEDILSLRAPTEHVGRATLPTWLGSPGLVRRRELESGDMASDPPLDAPDVTPKIYARRQNAIGR